MYAILLTDHQTFHIDDVFGVERGMLSYAVQHLRMKVVMVRKKGDTVRHFINDMN